jgi:DNA-binding MarR family transcriptional regulator
MPRRRPLTVLVNADDASALAARTAAGLTRLAEIGHLSAWRKAQEFGLSTTQLHVLRLLGPAPLRPSDLARLLDVTAATTSDALAALVRKRLLTRIRSDSDRRSFRVQLTAKGRALVGKAGADEDAMQVAVRALTPAEQATLHAIVVRMISALQQQGVITGARTCRGCQFFRESVRRGDRPHHCAFINAPLAEHELRPDCADHRAA